MTVARPYINAGNELVLSLAPAVAKRILDVGCGAGDNARRLMDARPGLRIEGITHNPQEAEMAAKYMAAVHVLDIEHNVKEGPRGPFDLLIFSHVLEHVRQPTEVLRRFLPLLVPNGYVLIAVPNTLEWRTRMHFLGGKFQYSDHGILDRTHLRFFTFETAATELVDPVQELALITRAGRGALPFGRLRNWLLPRGVSAALDEAAVRRFPNLFAGEVALLARRRG